MPGTDVAQRPAPNMAVPGNRWARLARLGGLASGIAGGPGWMALFSTHPPLEARIAALGGH